MHFSPVLSSTHLSKLRSASYSGRQYISLMSNRVVFAGQITSGLVGYGSWASFGYSSVTVGAYTDVEVGQALIISATNDITKGMFLGRVRLAPTATDVYSNESSQDIPAFSFFFIVDRHDIAYRLSRPSSLDPATAVELIDYDESYSGEKPVIVGLKTGYANWVDPATGKYRIHFDIGPSYPVAQSATIASYLYEFAAGTYTVISGSLSANAVTVDFDPGEYIGEATVVDSAGNSKTRYFAIKAHDDSYPPDLGFEGASINGDLTSGYTMSLPAFEGVDDLLTHTFAIAWRAYENYGGTAGTLTGENVDFVGWLEREDDPITSDPTYSVLASATLQFWGVGPSMNRIFAELLGFQLYFTATQWGQILGLTVWRAIAHFLENYTTVLDVSDLTFDDRTTRFTFADITTQGGSIMSAIAGVVQGQAGIASMIDANLEFAPWGALDISRDVTYLDDSERAALPVVADWTATDALSITRSYDPMPSVGKVDGDGTYWNNYSNRTGDVFTARAPGIAQGESQGSSTLPSQVLSETSNSRLAKDELRQRVGNKYEYDNCQEFLDVVHPDGYIGAILLASRVQLFTWTLDSVAGANGVNRVSYDTSALWTIDALSFQFDTTIGGFTVNVRYRRVSPIGGLADDTTQHIPPPGSIPPVADPGYPAFDFDPPELIYPDDGLTPDAATPPLTPPGKALWADGREVITWNDDDVFFIRNFIPLPTPPATTITPADLGSYQNKQVVADPSSDFTTQVAALDLASDGTNSAVWYAPSVLPTVPAWSKGADVAGVYETIRATMLAGSVLVYSPAGATSTTTTYDFTLSDGGWTAQNSASYSAGVGWVLQATDSGIFITGLPTCTLTQFDVYYSTSGFTSPTTNALRAENGTLVILSPAFVSGGSFTPFSGSVPSTTEINARLLGGGGAGSVTINKIVITIQVASGAANVCLSTDYGATFAAAITVGAAAAGATGFDVQKAGQNSFAAADGAVYRATTLGGAYSLYYAITGSVQAACIIVPYYDWSGGLNTSNADPDIIVGLTGPDGSSRTMLCIEGGATAGTVHGLTPVAGFDFDNPNAITSQFQHHIAAYGKVSGIYKLYETVNRGSSWHLSQTLTAPTFLRGRRHDAGGALSGANRGQLFLADSDLYYSSKWGSAGVAVRHMPAAMKGVEPLY